jgi:transposase
MSEKPKRRKRPSRSTEDPNTIGPNSKLTSETATAIVNAVRAGNTQETAAAYAGINKDTLYTWMRKGRAATRGAYHQFVDQLDQALAASEVRDLALIGKAAEEQWQAAAWRLERRYPEKYGRRTRLEGQVDVRGVPYLDIGKLTGEELEQLSGLLRKAAPVPEELPRGGRPALELVAGDPAP